MSAMSHDTADAASNGLSAISLLLLTIYLGRDIEPDWLQICFTSFVSAGIGLMFRGRYEQ